MDFSIYPINRLQILMQFDTITMILKYKFLSSYLLHSVIC
jgi:hypothetical protein